MKLWEKINNVWDVSFSFQSYQRLTNNKLLIRLGKIIHSLSVIKLSQKITQNLDFFGMKKGSYPQEKEGNRHFKFFTNSLYCVTQWAQFLVLLEKVLNLNQFRNCNLNPFRYSGNKTIKNFSLRRDHKKFLWVSRLWVGRR